MSFFSISLPAGGAFAPYERFAFGKTSAQGQFICLEHFNFPRYP